MNGGWQTKVKYLSDSYEYICTALESNPGLSN